MQTTAPTLRKMHPHTVHRCVCHRRVTRSGGCVDESRGLRPQPPARAWRTQHVEQCWLSEQAYDRHAVREW